MANESIKDVIANYYVTLINAQVVPNTPDAAHAIGLVRYGQLQDDPVQYRTVVLIHLRDPDEQSDNRPQWSDIPIAFAREWLGKYPAAEIGGGGGFWARRLVITVDCYFVNTRESREEARSITTWIEEAIHLAIENDCDGGGIVDSFGQVYCQSTVVNTIAIEQGGPPDQFIYRVKLYVSAVTEMP